MVLYSPDWAHIGFSFILLTVNMFRHPTLIGHGLYSLLAKCLPKLTLVFKHIQYYTCLNFEYVRSFYFDNVTLSK